MNQKGQINRIIGFILALIGAYLILVAFKLAQVLQILNEFLLANPSLNNIFILFVIGVFLAYIGYSIYNQ